MAITFSTEIFQVKVKKSLDGLTNVITEVKCKITGTDEEGYSQTYDSVPVFLPAPDSGSFIDIDSVDQATLISWVEAQPDWTMMTEDETAMRNYINHFKNLEYIDDYKMPWMS